MPLKSQDILTGKQINKVWKFRGLQLLKMLFFWKEPDWVDFDLFLICYTPRKRHLWFFSFFEKSLISSSSSFYETQKPAAWEGKDLFLHLSNHSGTARVVKWRGGFLVM